MTFPTHKENEKTGVPSTQIEDVATRTLSIDDVDYGKKVFDSDRAEAGDYSGAVKKTDPAEIALVRKLDWRVMPCLFVMYFL